MREIAIDLDSGECIRDNFLTWNNVFNLGTGFSSITDDFRAYILEAQREIGFNFVRIKDIFYPIHSFYYISNKELVYNWNLVNEVLDVFVDLGVNPILEVGFGDYILKFKGISDYISIYESYKKMISDFLNHVLNRYGIEVVSNWGIEILLFPSDTLDFKKYEKENRQIYSAVYEVLINNFKGNIRLGTGFLSFDGIIDMEDLDYFLKNIKEDFPSLDFIIVHLYSNHIPEKMSLEEYNRMVYINAKKSCSLVNKLILKYFPMVLLGVTESFKSKDYRNDYYDTCVGAVLLIEGFLDFFDSRITCISNWTLIDSISSLEHSHRPFYGGHGIYTKDGIKKPIYYACSFISQLGYHIVSIGRDYIASQKDDSIKILLLNGLDELTEGMDSCESFFDFYRSYENSKSFKIELRGLKGEYKIIKETLSREFGSALDIWYESGFGNSMSREEIEYLKAVSRPRMIVDHKLADGFLNIDLDLDAFSFALINIEKSI